MKVTTVTKHIENTDASGTLCGLSYEDPNTDPAIDDFDDYWNADCESCVAAHRTRNEVEPESLPIFEVVLHIHAASRAEVGKVMAERLGHDEDYGFPYRVSYQTVRRHVPTPIPNEEN